VFTTKFLPVAAGLVLLSLLLPKTHFATAGEKPAWTLDVAVRAALQVAPEIREATAEVAAREGALTQAGAWPNPSIDLRADQKVGIEDGSGGTDLAQVMVSQPLPLTRLTHQRAQAEAQLAAARERLRLVRLTRETQASRAFHALQLAQARLTLAEERVAFVTGLDPTTAPRAGRIVRYLTPMEQARLSILRETAEQEAASAEGKYSEAVTQFRVLLALDPTVVPQMVALAPVDAPPPLETLLERLDAHPALAAGSMEVDAARAGVSLARAMRFADPTIGVFRETDFLNGARRDYNGVILSVQVPLWNLNSGNVARASAEADQALDRRAAQRRDLDARLRQSQLHLGHLIEQAARYRERLLGPAQQMLTLARRGFESGEQHVLALVDAYNTYFDAEVRYLELLQEAGQEAAELRFAAGQELVPTEAKP